MTRFARYKRHSPTSNPTPVVHTHGTVHGSGHNAQAGGGFGRFTQVSREHWRLARHRVGYSTPWPQTANEIHARLYQMSLKA
jgi:hypothetical protein